MQFGIPKAKGDTEDAEMAISKGLGGGANANMARWKAGVQTASGKSIDDTAKVEEIKIGDTKATYLDVSGTYTVPFARRRGCRRITECWRSTMRARTTFTHSSSSAPPTPWRRRKGHLTTG